jgi:anti-sigma B factor antagonist
VPRRPRNAKIAHLNEYLTLPAIPARKLIDVSAQQITTDVAVFHVCGEIDAFTAPMLRAALADQLDPLLALLVLDLSGVTFLSASGIRVLLEVRERAALTGTPLRLVHTTRAVQRVLDVLRLNHLLRTYPTLADALASQAEPVQPCAGAGRRSGYPRRPRRTTTLQLIRLRSNTAQYSAGSGRGGDGLLTE